MIFATPFLSEVRVNVQAQPACKYDSTHTYALIDSMFDLLTVGIACVRTNGEVMYANKAAVSMLKRCEALQQSVQTKNIDGQLSTAVLKQLQISSRHTILIRHQQIELQVQVEPFRGENGDHVHESERRHGAMLILHESGNMMLPSASQLKSLYNLTQAEARLALELCAGNTPAECAEHFAVSIATIRSQLRGLMEKTGSHRQSELLAKLLSSPSTSVRLA